MNNDVLRADHALVAALARGDTRAAAAWLDDEFTWVDCNGRILDKAQAASAPSHSNRGYSLFSLTRASAVVNCQSALA